MEKALSGRDFDLADLKNGHTTIYLVLPPDMLEVHKRFLRIFVQLAIRVMARKPTSKTPVLFLLDEFYSLGAMTSIEKAAGLLPSTGVKLWPILQNLGQIKELYPDNWSTFFSASGVIQIFGVNDLETSEYVVRRLGKTTQEIEIDERGQRVVSTVLEPDELEQLVARKTGLQVIDVSGEPPLLLRRMNYDQSYRKNQYSDDPDHPTPWYKKLNPY